MTSAPTAGAASMLALDLARQLAVERLRGPRVSEA